MRAIRFSEKLATFEDYWHPRIVGELNGQHVKVVKLQGEFVWHNHANEDELFLVLKGSFCMHYVDLTGNAKAVDVNEGECLIVPRGVYHRPVAEREAHVLLFEPIGTINTGSVQDVRTVKEPERV